MININELKLLPDALVSVIMPVYNAAHIVKEAIESVLSQSHINIELIIINDGSTDESDKVIRSFSDPRIMYVQQANLGQCAACNTGYKKSSGSFIKFFDADDVMNKEHIAEHLKKHGTDSNAVSFCSWGRFFEDNITTTTFIKEPYWEDMEPLQWIKSNMHCKYDMMPGWFWLIPRTVIENAGGWNERLNLNNDFEFSVRLLMHASYVYFAPGAKMFYRSGKDTSLSANKSEEALHGAILSAKLGCSYLLKRENSNEMRLLCANKYSFWLYYIYPHYPHLVKDLENEIELMGGTNRKIDDSFLMHRLQKVIGWKAAKRVKTFMYRIGYRAYLLPFKKKITGTCKQVLN